MDAGVAIERLNELEMVRGEIWANVWQTDYIVRISPKEGRVLGWINLKGLLGAPMAKLSAGGCAERHCVRRAEKSHLRDRKAVAAIVRDYSKVAILVALARPPGILGSSAPAPKRRKIDATDDVDDRQLVGSARDHHEASIRIPLFPEINFWSAPLFSRTPTTRDHPEPETCLRIASTSESAYTSGTSNSKLFT